MLYIKRGIVEGKVLPNFPAAKSATIAKKLHHDQLMKKLQRRKHEGAGRGVAGVYWSISSAFVTINREEETGVLGNELGATAWGHFLHGAFQVL